MQQPTDLIRVNPDAEDCLAEAAERYRAEHSGLAGYDLEPKWDDESDREWVRVSIPRWLHERINDTSGT